MNTNYFSVKVTMSEAGWNKLARYQKIREATGWDVGTDYKFIESVIHGLEDGVIIIEDLDV